MISRSGNKACYTSDAGGEGKEGGGGFGVAQRSTCSLAVTLLLQVLCGFRWVWALMSLYLVYRALFVLVQCPCLMSY